MEGTFRSLIALGVRHERTVLDMFIGVVKYAYYRANALATSIAVWNKTRCMLVPRAQEKHQAQIGAVQYLRAEVKNALHDLVLVKSPATLLDRMVPMRNPLVCPCANAGGVGTADIASADARPSFVSNRIRSRLRW